MKTKTLLKLSWMLIKKLTLWIYVFLFFIVLVISTLFISKDQFESIADYVESGLKE